MSVPLQILLMCAWCGFTSATDRQRLGRLSDLSSLSDLCKTVDNKLFNAIIDSNHHTVHYLPPPLSQAALPNITNYDNEDTLRALPQLHDLAVQLTVTLYNDGSTLATNNPYCPSLITSDVIIPIRSLHYLY